MARFRAVWQSFSKRRQSGEKVRRWFRPRQEEPSNDKDREIINYITLAVIHDHIRRPQWKRIYPESAYRDDSIWYWLRVWSDERNKRHIEIYEDSIREAEKIRTEIQLALEYVQADLASDKARGTGQDTTFAKGGKIGALLWKLYEITILAFFKAMKE